MVVLQAKITTKPKDIYRLHDAEEMTWESTSTKINPLVILQALPGDDPGDKSQVAAYISDRPLNDLILPSRMTK